MLSATFSSWGVRWNCMVGRNGDVEGLEEINVKDDLPSSPEVVFENSRDL